MSAIPFARLAGAAGMIAVALLIAALVTLPAATPTGAGYSPSAPTMFVNRALKGDRLPISADPIHAPGRTLAPKRMPFGCDAAFSPIAEPRLAHVLGRCMA
jgi:hypothetical protein